MCDGATIRPLPLTADLKEYQRQAEELLAAHAAGEASALGLIHRHHPRFLDEKVRWLPLPMTDEQIAAAALEIDDTRLVVARLHSFRDWDSLSEFTLALSRREAGVFEFEYAAEAVITGDEETLVRLLGQDPGLATARSSRITCFDPPVHRATLLHYIAANGVEGHRQLSPPNAVRIARILLEAGADPNALAEMYGGTCTTLAMLVSSTPPAEAGVQIPLIETLLDAGADLETRGKGHWASPLITALSFGFVDAAETLVRRGAKVESLPAAAGLGRVEDARALLAEAGPELRHGALALAAQLGRIEIVRMLLDAGEDPDRFNPEGMHAHATPLHHAALGGHKEVARLLVERGARIDIADRCWRATPAGWAEYGGHGELAEYLRRSGG